MTQSSQNPKLTDGDDKKDVSNDESHENSQQARVARSLQVHDYVSAPLRILISAQQFVD